NVGVSRHMNFCVEHQSLPKAERVRLREAQKSGTTSAAKQEPKKAAIAKKPTAKKPVVKPSRKSKASEAKRIGGTKPVVCRVEGCKNPGVRTFGNFCVEHHVSLSKTEQKKIRDAQVKQ